MASNTLDYRDLSATLTEVVAEALLVGGEMHLPGLGTFRLRHEVSRIETMPDGTRIVHPPRDTVAFIPDLADRR